MAKVERVILIVLDGVGAGAAPDARHFGDEGSHTLRNVATAAGGLAVPHLEQLGLGNITAIPGVPPVTAPQAAFGRMQPGSAGKDTTTGHWELAGILLDEPFPTYPDGFPLPLMAEFEARIGRQTLGNIAASGTQIIECLGEKHLLTGSPIVYTSVDSVFQVAAHTDVIGETELYAICETARKLLQGEHAVARVIARPFAGVRGSFLRTSGRRDFSLPPPWPTLLDQMVAHPGHTVEAIGKIGDIFAGRGFTDHIPTQDNAEGVRVTLQRIREKKGPGLIFTNLVDFDSLYGHRNDPKGFAAALQAFDASLPQLLGAMRSTDVLMITADHGVDPTTEGTDHTREYVPLLVVGGPWGPGTNLGTRTTFADIAATLLDIFGLPSGPHGTSFLGLSRFEFE